MSFVFIPDEILEWCPRRTYLRRTGARMHRGRLGFELTCAHVQVDPRWRAGQQLGTPANCRAKIV